MSARLWEYLILMLWMMLEFHIVLKILNEKINKNISSQINM